MSFFPTLFGHHKDKSAASLKTQIDHVFDNFFTQFPSDSLFSKDMPGFFSPSLDLKETDEGLELKVDLPDMNKDDINLEVVGDHLVISGEKSTEKKDEDKAKGYYVMERSFGSFRRAVPLPFSLNDNAEVMASYNKGVLNVNIPKPPGAEKSGKKININ